MSSQRNLLRKVSYEVEVRDPQLVRMAVPPACPSPLVNPCPHPCSHGALVVPPVTRLSLRAPSGTVWPQGPFVFTSHFVGLPADWVSPPQDLCSGARNGTQLKLPVWMSESNFQNEVRCIC